MIETECFQELNVFFEDDGSLVPSLRSDGQTQVNRKNSSSSAGFFSRLFKRRRAHLNGEHSKCSDCPASSGCGKCKVTKSLHDLQRSFNSTSVPAFEVRQNRAFSTSGHPLPTQNASKSVQFSEQNTV
ncbi:hypothetical protein KIN20_024148 [Parelaphostrongylus tenuis]|nr:hypothetical protein KIN20_024148 [Parelaphostrongylus tenuis]